MSSFLETASIAVVTTFGLILLPTPSVLAAVNSPAGLSTRPETVSLANVIPRLANLSSWQVPDDVGGPESSQGSGTR
jgi:hypothetical protein